MTRVYDTIHGFIEITPLMKEFMDTEEFQRLRDLKQLGATTFVFPSANHTRFEHSIGVSHLAGKMIENLRENGMKSITNRDIEICRLAGLLHDIGHGPYSHLYDDYVRDKKEMEHEDRGCIIIKNMVKRYNIDISDDEVNEIIKMINPDEVDKYNWKYQIVANKINQLDVDKLDYIQRDCFYLGLKCGGEYSRIIQDAKVFYDEEKSIICWPIKLQYEIFQLFATRYRLHKQVYNHPNVKACEFIIIDMLKVISQSMENIMLQGDSIIYCKYVDDLRMKLFQRNHPKFIGELTFVNEKIYENYWKKYIDYMDKNTIIYQKLEIGFGGSKNPLKNIKYFKDKELIKNDPVMFSFMIPSYYKEIIIRIYCREKNNIHYIKNCYKYMLNIYNKNDESITVL
jgi:deoxynucleoside triphosphate triphosphohydrolase SAMHD1